MHVRFSPNAIADLKAIRDYISQDSPQAAAELIDRVFTVTKLLEAFPELGRDGRVMGTRELVIPGTSYIAVYTIPNATTVDVENIIHGRQKWPPGD